MTLVVEVEQERVNDAARVGQGTDLVVAPLFLCCLSLSLSLLLTPSLSPTVVLANLRPQLDGFSFFPK